MEFELPAPRCPAPAGPVVVPDVAAMVGDGPPVIATRGSSGFTTCSTSAASDVIPGEPRSSIVARAGDIIVLEVPAAWRILRWQGSDHPAVGEGANIWPPVDLPHADRDAEVPVPIRSGTSIASYTLWLVSADRRVVGSLDVQLRIRIAAP